MQIFIALIIGLAAGALGGLFGIGGGVLIVPALVIGLGFQQKLAQGTSLVALLAPVGLLAMLDYNKRGDVNFKVGGVIALGFLLGALAGSRVAVGLSEEVMRKSFAGFLALVAIWMFTKKG